jgi:hypothetical protein
LCGGAFWRTHPSGEWGIFVSMTGFWVTGLLIIFYLVRQRPVLISLLVSNFVPRGELCSLGEGGVKSLCPPSSFLCKQKRVHGHRGLVHSQGRTLVIKTALSLFVLCLQYLLW